MNKRMKFGTAIYISPESLNGHFLHNEDRYLESWVAFNRILLKESNLFGSKNNYFYSLKILIILIKVNDFLIKLFQGI